jgi:hypothetical protein
MSEAHTKSSISIPMLISIAVGLLAIVAQTVLVGMQFGNINTQLKTNDDRITYLEQHGSPGLQVLVSHNLDQDRRIIAMEAVIANAGVLRERLENLTQSYGIFKGQMDRNSELLTSIQKELGITNTEQSNTNELLKDLKAQLSKNPSDRN